MYDMIALGALAVTPVVLDETVSTEALVVTDAQAVSACLRFAHEHRMLVEPACGAALAAVYGSSSSSGDNADAPIVAKGEGEILKEKETVVVIVCGGSAVSLQMLADWSHSFGLSLSPQS